MKKEKEMPKSPLDEARENALSFLRAIMALRGEGGRSQMMHGIAGGVYNAPLDAVSELKALLTGNGEIRPFYPPMMGPEPKNEDELAAKKWGYRIGSPVPMRRK